MFFAADSDIRKSGVMADKILAAGLTPAYTWRQLRVAASIGTPNTEDEYAPAFR
jgi:hypothetical protein